MLHNRVSHSKWMQIADQSALFCGLFFLGMDIASFVVGCYVYGIILAVITLPIVGYGICHLFSGYRFDNGGLVYRIILKTHTVPYENIVSVVIAERFSTHWGAECTITHKLKNGRRACLIHTTVGIFSEEITENRLNEKSLWENVEALPENFVYSFCFSPYVYYNIDKLRGSKIYMPKETYDMLSKLYDFSSWENLKVIGIADE